MTFSQQISLNQRSGFCVHE